MHCQHTHAQLGSLRHGRCHRSAGYGQHYEAAPRPTAHSSDLTILEESHSFTKRRTAKSIPVNQCCLIAEHGSWNRHKYQGARIVRVTADPDGKNAKQEVFASGWIEGDQGYLGRPDDIILDKDGSILVSDDWAGAIYRISYKK